ncbi:16S rRNA (cytosine(1402)-N(4))-methyltransferase RsmH [Nakamurella endophytica]|uniref:Ribosomal RNA small subunit methyltransferase H n=1 Tax=Nakamurella endophytica TaxID=1748367 RepID=A0A917T6U1_9ACTN|nr:16S rRNA (cytosine(1402)-N(4))-methyltransferase RsmH [Nakamurella endophytica]GGM11502.1 ribosomal RNA small subunit methyltransferase H [Nakamurella endophytica]
MAGVDPGSATPPQPSRPDPASPADPAPADIGALDRLHVPVLADRVAELLAPALDGPSLLVDATLGMGGHTLLLLRAHPETRAVGIDRDPQALRIAGARLAAAGVADRAVLVHAVYDRIGEVLDEHGPADGVQAVLFDLGVSSLQLDEADRGFAYAQDAPLDMRMDPTTGITAADVLNTYSAGELARVLREYGEERFAGRIAAAVVRDRQHAPFDRSARLVDLVRAAIPAPARRTGGHPAKRTFQALRIEVNDELGALRRAVPAAVRHLAVGGRIVVLSYHSLEDRIVKQALAPLTRSTSPVDLPVDLPGHEPELAWITRGAGAPSDQEIAVNPRAASARLRAARRLRKAAA